jgi:hypothetical protein
MRYRLRTLLIVVALAEVFVALLGGTVRGYYGASLDPPGDFLSFFQQGALVGGLAGLTFGLITIGIAGSGFRFTVRELLLLTVVASVSIGWVVDHYWTGERAKLSWRNYLLEFALTSEGWTVKQNGWEVNITNGQKGYGGNLHGPDGLPVTYRTDLTQPVQSSPQR